MKFRKESLFIRRTGFAGLREHSFLHEQFADSAGFLDHIRFLILDDALRGEADLLEQFLVVDLGVASFF